MAGRIPKRRGFRSSAACARAWHATWTARGRRIPATTRGPSRRSAPSGRGYSSSGSRPACTAPIEPAVPSPGTTPGILLYETLYASALRVARHPPDPATA